jgi:Fe-Mn family superoxide dismutase
MAAGEHKVKPLPYAYDALESFLSKEVVTWHHDKHHAGYVNKRNEIEKKLESIDRSASNANWSDYGEMKRRESFNASGMILHEIYWENVGGNGKADDSLAVVKKIAQDFGSVANWEADFKACATASLGWAILCYDPSDGKLHNYLCDFHNDGAVWGAIPLIAIDVFEHAYYRQYGPDRGKYVAGFVSSLNWKAINERYQKWVPK